MITAYPPVLTEAHAADSDVNDFPDHANVLAIVATYQEKYDAMPWALLLDVMASLPSIHSPLRLSNHDAQVDMALMDIVADLRARGFLVMTTGGAVSTHRGDKYIERWNGKFTTRKKEARKNLAELRFQEFEEAKL